MIIQIVFSVRQRRQRTSSPAALLVAINASAVAKTLVANYGARTPDTDPRRININRDNYLRAAARPLSARHSMRTRSRGSECHII